VWDEISGGGRTSDVVFVRDWRKFDDEKSGRNRDDDAVLVPLETVADEK
jgi:hypothetical protein